MMEHPFFCQHGNQTCHWKNSKRNQPDGKIQYFKISKKHAGGKGVDVIVSSFLKEIQKCRLFCQRINQTCHEQRLKKKRS